MLAGRITVGSADDESVAITASAQFWAMIHGFVMLELAGYYGGDGAAGAAIRLAQRRAGSRHEEAPGVIPGASYAATT